MLEKISVYSKRNKQNLSILFLALKLSHPTELHSLRLSDTFLSPSRPDLGRREKINVNFLFSHFFLVPQKVLLKPFEVPQRSVKIKV